MCILNSRSFSLGTETHKGKGWGYVPHPKEGVGLQCKRLLDLARVHYLRRNGLEAELVHFVDRDTVSLENVLLLAWSDASGNDTSDLKCDTGDCICDTGDPKCDTGDLKCDTGDIKYDTGNLECDTGDHECDTGDLKCVMGDRASDAGDSISDTV